MRVPSLSVWNVWHMPLWAWRQYVTYQDRVIAEEQKQRARESGG